MPSTAKFKLKAGGGAWSAFSAGGFDAANGDVLTIRLEDLPALDVQRILVEVVSLSNGAGVLTFSDGGAPQPPTTDITVTLPATGIVAYLIRCTVYGSFNAAGTQTYDSRERVVVVRSPVRNLRKLAPSESTQYSTLEGWVNAFNEMVEALELSQFDFKDSVRCATAAALPAYVAAGSGSTKTLTAVANGVLTIDTTVATVLGDRILVRSEAASHVDHGLYKVTTEGTAGTKFVLTRSDDANTSAEMTAGVMVPVEEGTVNGDQLFMLTTNNPITLETSALTFTNFGVLTPLVTAALRGTVSAFGATVNAHYQSDGATAGGVWNAHISDGATPATAGNFRVSTPWNLQGRNVANTADVPVLVWQADWINLGSASASLSSVSIIGGTAGYISHYVGGADVFRLDPGAVTFPGAPGPTINTGTGNFTFGTATVRFGSLVVAPEVGQDAPAVEVAGQSMAFRAQVGGAASVGAGADGGGVFVWGGNGGEGTAALAAGDGSAAQVSGGTAGADNGGGGGDGGDGRLIGGNATGNGSGGSAFVRGGAGAGAGLDGTVFVGDSNTAAIEIGNAADDPPIGFPGQGAVSFSGNPAIDLGTNTVDVDVLRFGAAPPAAGAGRLSHATAFQGRDAAGAADAPVIDWGSTTADHVTIGGDDADLEGVNVRIPAGKAIEAWVAASVVASLGAAAGDYVAFGVTPPASGTLRFAAGSTVDALDAAGVGTYRVLDAGATTADRITIGANDADLEGVDIVAGSAGTFALKRAAATLLTADGTTIDAQAQALQTTSTLALNSGASWLRIGLVAGSGAGSAASTGAIRLPNATGIYARIAADSSDLNIARTTAANELILGNISSTLYVDSYAAVQFRPDNVNKLRIGAGATGGCQFGQYASASLLDQVSETSMRHAANGDCQHWRAHLGRSSTDAGAVELTLTGAAPGAGTRLLVTAGHGYAFRLTIVCYCSAGTDAGESVSWECVGHIKNVGGTTSLVGQPLNLSGAAWSAATWTPQFFVAGDALTTATVAITADDANDCLAVTCTGVAPGAGNNTYHWSCEVDITDSA